MYDYNAEWHRYLSTFGEGQHCLLKMLLLLLLLSALFSLYESPHFFGNAICIHFLCCFVVYMAPEDVGRPIIGQTINLHQLNLLFKFLTPKKKADFRIAYCWLSCQLPARLDSSAKQSATTIRKDIVACLNLPLDNGMEAPSHMPSSGSPREVTVTPHSLSSS